LSFQALKGRARNTQPLKIHRTQDTFRAD
jgi:hypothetical protein